MAVRDVVMAAAGVGGASPTFVALESNHTASASLVINKPTGTVEGDLMLAVLSSPAGNNDATFTSTGWSTLYTHDNGTNGGGGVLYKVAGASEGSSYTFAGNNAQFVGSIVTYRNAAIGVATFHVLGASTVVASGMTIPTSNSLFFAFYQHKDTGATFSAPSGMTSVVSNTSVGGSYNLFSELRGSGATGTRTTTVTGGVTEPSGFTFFITPSSFSQVGPFPISQATAQETVSTTALTINKPTGTREGDLMVAYLLGGGGTQSANGWVAPSGWTLAVNLHSGTTTGRPFNAIAYKVAGASEGSSYLFTSTTSRTLAGSIVTHRNGVYDATGTQDSGKNPLVPASVTATENYSRVVGIAGRDSGSATLTGPVGMSPLVTQNDATAPSWVIEQDDALIAATSSGTRSFAATSATSVNAILHTIKPAASYTKYAQYLANTTAGPATTDITINTASCVPGNLLLMVVTNVSSNTFGSTYVTPTGWTLLRSYVGTNDFDPSFSIFYRVADGTEATSYVVDVSTPNTLSGGMICLAGVDPSTITSAIAARASSTTSCVAPSLTATQNGVLLYLAFGANNNLGQPTFTPPSGMTEIFDIGNNGASTDYALTMGYQQGVSDGATGTKTVTSSVTLTYAHAVSIFVGAK